MAGDWIKVECITPDKPEVVAMAQILGIDQDAVVGKLIRVWAWADQNSIDGNAVSVTCAFLDRITFCAGFGKTMISVGWISGVDGSLTITNFDRHNGKSAKKRAVTNRRVADHRICNAESNAESNADVTPAALQKALPEKRREEIKEKSIDTSISGETDPPEKPLSVKKSREDRLHEVTIDAIEAYNEILAKPTGVLSRVSLTVGLPRRRQQVEKCLGTARDMCQELYGSPRITPEFWRQYWGEVALDPFRSGRQGGGRGHENWKPSFKYLVRVDTMLEVFDRATSDDSPQDEAA